MTDMSKQATLVKLNICGYYGFATFAFDVNELTVPAMLLCTYRLSGEIKLVLSLITPRQKLLIKEKMEGKRND